ncbi:MAG TPA: pyridoxal-dependent decarboxylase, partial [Ktedonobacteraceae bacterium]|nr:pyridoxal-dependent decarboxylase [Ktedonobacteraceae bacterium]
MTPLAGCWVRRSSATDGSTWKSMWHCQGHHPQFCRGDYSLSALPHLAEWRNIEMRECVLVNNRNRKTVTGSTLPCGREQVNGLAFDGEELRELGYQVIDEIADYLTDIQNRPVWQPMPEKVRATIRHQVLPEQGQPFAATLEFLQKMLLPYPQGNGHPRFAGWINSAPSHASILLKPLAAAMNPNCGIGEHAGQELERRTVQWIMDLCGFPVEGSAGVFVSGGSEANFTCLLAARQWAA